MGNLSPSLTHEINTLGSVRLAETAREAGARRFIFASSCSLYGAGGDAPCVETSPLRPLTAYGRSKLDVEMALTALAGDTFSPVFMRNATVYGPSPRLRLDLVVNNLTAHAVATGRVLLQSQGTSWRPLIHVNDVVQTIATMLVADPAVIHAQAFNVGRTGENYRVLQVAELVRAAVPGSRIEFAAGAHADERNYFVSFDKLERTFPELQLTGSVASGVEELARDLRARALSAADLDSPAYIRLARLAELRDRGAVDEDLRWVSTVPSSSVPMP
jgi:nucleoside-diphosphate-sugar epimerase